MERIRKLKDHYGRAKELYLRYERVLMPGTLLVGFIVDYITFTSINVKTAFTVLLAYWLGAGLIIFFINLYDENYVSRKLRFARLFSPLLLQFFFGALLGGSFIFYWFSGALSASWPFILLLVVLMVSNDMLRSYFHKPVLQLPIYFFVSLSLFSVILPFLFNSLSPWLFIAAGVVSTTALLGYTKLLNNISTAVREKKQLITTVVAGILALMNVLYFTNIIPPIPLSIREAGIYHNVERAGSAYLLSREEESVLKKIIPGQTLHAAPGSRLYAYTAIFAPANLTTPVRHRWEFRDESAGEWITADISEFRITGGRDEGFRGYSWKSNLAEGVWRVSVETARGQVLGRIGFNVIHTHEPPGLEIIER